MLSDESSSDSETGRFKGGSSNKNEQKASTDRRDDRFGKSDRGRPSENDRFRREFDRKRDERDRYERRSRERPRQPRYSPVRRRSRERSRDRSRRSRDRHGHSSRASSSRNKPKEVRSSSKERKRATESRSLKSPERKICKDSVRVGESTKKYDRKSRSRSSSSEYKTNRSVIQKPAPQAAPKRVVESPIEIADHVSDDAEDVVQPGSYYSMIPAVVKEKSAEKEKTEESSEIDSSDDERLRAKLLNLERELTKTRKKKHKKKHKRKSSKSNKEKDSDDVIPVEVSSTTDIQEREKSEEMDSKTQEIVEVTSTQKTAHKESSEEGEILSDDDSQNSSVINENDLRHKLKRCTKKPEGGGSPDLRERLKSTPKVCGPALPPHLADRFRQSTPPEDEGPALPSHVKKDRNIGPSIPSEMRKALAEADCEIVHGSSDEDTSAIGPLPAGAESKWTDAHQRLEERALDIKIKKIDGHTHQTSDVKKREKWMLELPEGKAKILGLEARSFRAKEGPDMSDRSSWTDTPEEKARKAAGAPPEEEDSSATLQRDARSRHIENRDQEQEKAVKKHKKKHKREESLLEIHEKKLKKKKKKEDKEEKKERRPFSRDVDLQANRFDEAQKRSIIKKAQELDTRFSRGEAKFL